MKPIRKLLLWVVVSPLLVLSSCMKDKITRTYQIAVPVIAEKSAVLASIKASPSVMPANTGKIFVYGRYIFMNEPGKGVHMIDNQNPATPMFRAFIPVPGNYDIAVKGNILYADMHTDLLAIDITNPLIPELKKVVADVFPDRRYQMGYFVDTNKVIVGWNVKDTTVKVGDDLNAIPGWGCVNCLMELGGNSNVRSATGQAGSMSRMVIVNDHLYSVSNSYLSVHDISQAADPVKQNGMYWGGDLETLFPFKDKLFIGSASGLLIADISNPVKPIMTGVFAHARACDPVVTDGEKAYVTLRSGNFCAGTIDQLDIVDVKNVNAPFLIKTYPMFNPHGLGLNGNFLYLCDGDDGLKVYDVTQSNAIRLVEQLKIDDAYDVIIQDNRLLMVAGKGLYQYQILANGRLKFLSVFTIHS